MLSGAWVATSQGAGKQILTLNGGCFEGLSNSEFCASKAHTVYLRNKEDNLPSGGRVYWVSLLPNSLPASGSQDLSRCLLTDSVHHYLKQLSTGLVQIDWCVSQWAGGKWALEVGRQAYLDREDGGNKCYLKKGIGFEVRRPAL